MRKMGSLVSFSLRFFTQSFLGRAPIIYSRIVRYNNILIKEGDVRKDVLLISSRTSWCNLGVTGFLVYRYSKTLLEYGDVVVNTMCIFAIFLRAHHLQLGAIGHVER